MPPPAAPLRDPSGRRRRRRRSTLALGLVVAVALLVGSCSGESEGASPAPGGGDEDRTSPLRITTVSGPPEYVTGGSAVVAVDSPAGADLDEVRVTLDGTDVTSRFAPDDAPYRSPTAPARLLATLTGLPEGESTMVATNGDDEARLTIVDHPVHGPLFSGQLQSPFVCTTDVNDLGPPVLPECGAEPTVRWVYVDTTGKVRDLPTPGGAPAVPDDVATTTTTLGAEVPFVVRVERSVQNRSITDVAILDPRPGTGGPVGDGSADGWDPSGWNGRLVLRFGGGCGVTYSQGTVDPDVLQLDLLADGYAVASGSLTAFQTACNATVAAETALVVTEHVSETYGPPRHTIGSGGSGGAIQLFQIAQNYPGILDALSPTSSFPDAASIAAGVSDCGLLERWFGRDGGPAGIIPEGQPNGADLTAEQQMAITGFASPLTCAFWTATYVDTLDAAEGCHPALVDQVYDLAVRPRGARCTWQDGNVNILGRDPATGYAARPLDNVGVQYGLDALADGAIGVDEFLELNEHIGGYDLDGTWIPDRERAGDDVLERTYAAGQITAGTATAEAGALGASGSGGLVDVPVIVLDGYTDELGDIHDRQRAFAIRERLRTPDGTDDPNLSIWTVPAPDRVESIATLLGGGAEDWGAPAVRVLDQWLTAAEDGPDDGSWPERLARAKPAEAEDTCELPSGEVFRGPETYEPGSPCAAAYPVHADPRRAAGAPLVEDVLACTLVDVDPDAYGVAFTDTQAERLRSIFPDGVCDWSATGRGQKEPAGTWQTW